MCLRALFFLLTMQQRLYTTVVSVLFSLVSFSSFGQAQKTVYNHRVFWHKTEFNQIFKNHFGVGGDFVLRTKNELGQGNMFSSPLRESFRPWVHYQFSEYARLSVSPVGIMHTNEYIGKVEDYARLDYKEWRTTFQFFHHKKQWQGRIIHTWRYRYELRWQEQPANDDFRFFTRFRFRYRIRILMNNKTFYENYVAYAAISNELGINVGKNVVLNIFNQNRLYVGFGTRVLNSLRVELRYVDRFRTRGATGYEFDHGRGFMVGIYIDQLSDLGKRSIPQVRFWD